MVYLQIDLVEVSDDDIDFNLLARWKASENRFLVLSSITRDLLTVQVSTVALEQAFSACGRLTYNRRTMLSEESVETCICLRDWFLTKNRK